MATKNDVTGDAIISRVNTKAFDENFARIFGKKKTVAYSEDWQTEERAKAIAQNGNDGLHYNQS